MLRTLERCAVRGDSRAVLQLIACIVPRFKTAADTWQGGRVLAADAVVRPRFDRRVAS
jgi:hypothetical protein